MFDESEHTDTQRRIIEVAGEIFAESGYRHTTIRTICDRARVNVAAVNYHFGGKKNLYLAALKYWRTRAWEEHPFDLAAHMDRPPEERLRAFIHSLLSRILGKGDGSLFARLMAQEFIQPTSALDVILEETIRPNFTFLSATVGPLLKDQASDHLVRLCCASIAGQIFFFFTARPVIRRLLYAKGFEEKDIPLIADHITRFSLYAIKEIAAKSQGEKE